MHTVLLRSKYLFFLSILSLSLSAQNHDSVSVGIDTSEYIPGDLDYNLIIAAEKGDPGEVLRLLNQGAAIDTRTFEGVTPLMYAVQNEDLETCKILLFNGADPKLRPYSGPPALIASIRTGNNEIVELLIRKGAEVDVQDKQGITPLMYAAAFNLYLIADLLIYYDADLNLTDNQGNTALIVASYYGNTEIVTLLLEHKATLDKSDYKGYSPLHCAAQNNNADVAGLLISNGAGLELKNNPGYTPLALAVLNNNVRLSQLLINKGSDVNSKISYSLAPLNLAKTNKNDTIIQLLKEHHARPNIMPSYAYTSVDFGFLISGDDAYFGAGLGFHDNRYNFILQTAIYHRISPVQVLRPVDSRTYYQYWEKRSFLNIGLSKNFKLITWEKDRVNGIGIGSQMIYTYGKYRGSSEKPDKQILFSPYIYPYFQFGLMIIMMGYEYIDFDIPHFSPHRFTLQIQFLIPGKHNRQSLKKVLWYL